MAFKAVVIDDEPAAVQSLVKLLTVYRSEVTVIGTASSALEGVKLINKVQPEVVFLDIEMPHGTGFDLLEALPERKFQVIFVTAYDHFAINAIRYNALDYLLKPIDPDDLTKAVDEAIKRKTESSVPAYDHLLDHIRHRKPTKLAVPDRMGMLYFDLDSVIRIEAKGNYSQLVLEDHKPLLVSRKLKVYEEVLDKVQFIRIHNSHIINLAHLKSFSRRDGGEVILSNDDMVEVSKKFRDRLKQALQNFSTNL